jgi:hypothetical protein
MLRTYEGQLTATINTRVRIVFLQRPYSCDALPAFRYSPECRAKQFGHHSARSQSLGCGLIIDEKRPNGLDVPASIGLRLLRFLTGWTRNDIRYRG